MNADRYYEDDTPFLTVWVRNGIVQWVTNIPTGFTVRIVDEDTDGCDPDADDTLEWVNGRPAAVTYWSDDAA